MLTPVPEPEKVSILLVDDHPENLLALEALLSNLGQNLVRQYVERSAGPNATADARWRVFGALLASPRLPSTTICSLGL